jgi:uncharacterized protein (DUF2249 family)
MERTTWRFEMTTPAPLVLDVRDILRSGGEPFGAIMQTVAALAPGQGLRLLATFEPVPLFTVLGSRGFTHTANPLDDGDWEVLFMPQTTASSDQAENGEKPPSQGFDEPPLQSLDNRFLPPPEPMVRTLQAVEDLPVGKILEMFVDREPLLLYRELRQRGHDFVADKQADGGYRVQIRRNG